jgi:hypothetical protein
VDETRQPGSEPARPTGNAAGGASPSGRPESWHLTRDGGSHLEPNPPRPESTGSRLDVARPAPPREPDPGWSGATPEPAVTSFVSPWRSPLVTDQRGRSETYPRYEMLAPVSPAVSGSRPETYEPDRFTFDAYEPDDERDVEPVTGGGDHDGWNAPWIPADRDPPTPEWIAAGENGDHRRGEARAEERGQPGGADPDREWRAPYERSRHASRGLEPDPLDQGAPFGTGYDRRPYEPGHRSSRYSHDTDLDDLPALAQAAASQSPPQDPVTAEHPISGAPAGADSPLRRSPTYGPRFPARPASSPQAPGGQPDPGAPQRSGHGLPAAPADRGAPWDDSPDASGYGAAPASGAGYGVAPASGAGYGVAPASGAGYGVAPASGAGYGAAPASGSGYADRPAAGAGYADRPASGAGHADRPASGAGYGVAPASGAGYGVAPTSGAGHGAAPEAGPATRAPAGYRVPPPAPPGPEAPGYAPTTAPTDRAGPPRPAADLPEYGAGYPTPSGSVVYPQPYVNRGHPAQSLSDALRQRPESGPPEAPPPGRARSVPPGYVARDPAPLRDPASLREPAPLRDPAASDREARPAAGPYRPPGAFRLARPAPVEDDRSTPHGVAAETGDEPAAAEENSAKVTAVDGAAGDPIGLTAAAVAAQASAAVRAAGSAVRAARVRAVNDDVTAVGAAYAAAVDAGGELSEYEPQAAAEFQAPRRVPGGVLPQRVPAAPDVPDVPDDEPEYDDYVEQEPAPSPLASPELARIATHLRSEEDIEQEAPGRPDGFDMDAVLAAVREVEGVRDAQLRPNPNGVHTLRLDLAEGADGARVSREVARLLKQRMGLAAEPRRHSGAGAAGVPAAPVEPPSLPDGPGGAPATRAAHEVHEAAEVRGGDEPAGPGEPPGPAGDPGAAATPSPNGVPIGSGLAVPPRAPEAARDTTPQGTTHHRDSMPVAGAAPAPRIPIPASAAENLGGAAAANAGAGRLADDRGREAQRRHAVASLRGRGPAETRGGPAGEAAPPLRRAARSGEGSRVVLDQVQVNTLGLDATVIVRLLTSGGPAEGRASGPAVDGYVLRLAAVAAASAIDQLLATVDTWEQQRSRCFVEHAAVLPLGSCEVAVVVVLLVCGGWVEQLSGSALVNGDPRQAVVRATLAAVNRRLDGLLG